MSPPASRSRLLLVMNAILDTTTFEPSPEFVDPRLGRHFDRRCWPLCNGEPAPPPDAPGLHERRCLEFLAAYYHVNVATNELQAARRSRASKRIVNNRLRKLVSAMATLEVLEDRYAPIGFFGEPVMKGTRYQNIVFIRPELPKLYPKASMLSSHIAVPGIEGIPASELQGPIKIFRFGHGKVDS